MPSRDAVFDIVLQQKKNVFITAGGGSGKSYLLRQLYDYAIAQGYREGEIALTSTTGVSAYNIGGQTIHSWCGIILPSDIARMSSADLRLTVSSIVRRVCKSRRGASISKAKLLLVDEISMLGGYYLEVLDQVCKIVRKNDKVLGGLQMVSTGDMMQLQSVGDVFIFESEVWEELHCTYIILETFYRFTDPLWTKLLTRCRVGELTSEDKKLLETRLISKSELDHWDSNTIRPTMILPTHKLVESYNKDELDRLPGQSYRFPSMDSAYTVYESIENSNTEIGDEISVTDAHRKRMDQVFPIDPVFTVKVGSQVMLRKNFNIEEGLVNGCRGIVEEVRPDLNAILVRWEQRTCLIGIRWDPDLHMITQSQFDLSRTKPIGCEWIFPIEYETREFDGITIPHSILRESGNRHIEETRQYTVMSRIQFPLTLSASVTIHSSQGCTLSSIIVDVGKSIFSKGQSYVALSRCKSLSGVHILNLDFKKIRADETAKAYENEIRKKAIFIQE
jgi:ATP-dependent DNA helicase PIF1